MLAIRAEQINALTATPRAAFVPRVARVLREQLADFCEATDDEALAEAIERGIEAAARHGIVGRWDICRFIACQRVLGEGFDSDPAHPWPRQVLGRQDLSPTKKMDRIERHYLRPRIRRTRAER